MHERGNPHESVSGFCNASAHVMHVSMTHIFIDDVFLDVVFFAISISMALFFFLAVYVPTYIMNVMNVMWPTYTKSVGACICVWGVGVCKRVLNKQTK